MTNIDEEIWKDIVGYNGLYKISNYGRVMSLYNDGRILKPNSSGPYFHVNLFLSGNQKTQRIHRLVAIHFLRKPISKLKILVNHKDCNKINNHHSNLEWCSPEGNCKHAKKHGRTKVPFTRGEKNGRSILTEQKVLLIREYCKTHNGVQAAIEFGVSKNTIFDIKAKRTWSHI